MKLSPKYLGSLLLFSALTTSVYTNPYSVTVDTDTLPNGVTGELRNALYLINTTSDVSGNISFTPSMTITLSGNLPAIIVSGSTTQINTTSPVAVTINGGSGPYQPFFADHGNLMINDVSLSSTAAIGGAGGTGHGGGGGGAGLGGGLFVRGGTTATLSSVTLSGCNATGGTGGSVAGAGGGGGGGLFGSGGVGGPTPRGAGGGGGGVYGQGGSGRNVNIFGGGGGGGGGFFGNGGLGGGTTFGGGGGGGGYNASGGAATSGGGGGGGIAFAGGNGTGTTDAGGSGGGGLLATGASNSGQAGGAGGNGGGSGGGGAGGLPPAGAGGAFGGAGSGGNPGTVGGSSPNATDGGNGGPGGPGGSDGGGGGGGAGASGTASGIGGNGNSGGNGGANGGGGGGAQGGSGGSGHGGLGGSGGTGGAYGGGGGGGGGGGSTSSTPGAGGGNGGNGYAVGGGQFSDGGGGGGGGASAIGVVSSGVGASGGNGAFGSGGGGSGFCEMTGNTVGNGGFGGGGGGAAAIEIVLPGGNGGFGGGGGSGNGGGTSPGGFGGTGGGNNGSGGGGAGLGGAIFLEYDSLNGAANLNINDGCSFSGNTVAAGTGANPGQALGADIFMMYQTLIAFTLNSSSLTLLNPIESDGGAGGGSAAFGGVELTGTGQTLTLNGSPMYGYGGGTSVGNSMTLALGSGTAAGIGPIALNSISTLQAAASVTVPNAISTQDVSTIDTQTNNMTLSGGISGPGSITKVGSGALTITNTNGYVGDTTVQEGTLIVNGSLTATPMTTVDTGATLKGIGTISKSVIVSGTLQPGNSAVGTLNTGSVTFNSGSNFVVEINPTQGSLVNIGTVGSTIDIISGSTMTVLLDPGSYTSGQTYTVIQAAKPGTLSGTFTTAVDIPPLFNVIVIYNPDPSVQILLERNPFASMGLKGNAASVAACFETATPTAGTDLDTVFIELLFAPSSEALQHAFNQIQPSQLNALQLSQENVNTRILSVLSLREADLHRACKPQSETWGVWADAFGDAMHQNHQQGQYGFRAATGAALVGIDGHATSNLHLGLGGAYTWTSLDWNGKHGDGDISSGYGFAYGTWRVPHFFLDGSFVGGYNNYKANRHIDFLGIDRHAKSEHHGYTLAGRLTGGFPFRAWKAEIAPLLSVDYDFVHQTAFNEHGAQSLNLQVHEKNANLLRAEAGFRVTRRCPDYVVETTKSKWGKKTEVVVSSASWLPSFQLTVIREWRFQGTRIRFESLKP